jgi:hypothetical protein
LDYMLLCSSWVEQAVLHDEEYGDVYANFGCSLSLTRAGSLLAVGECSCILDLL